MKHHDLNNGMNETGAITSFDWEVIALSDFMALEWVVMSNHIYGMVMVNRREPENSDGSENIHPLEAHSCAPLTQHGRSQNRFIPKD